jgi:glycosyltransferase involved in cell wall biosynthesis
MKFERVVFGIPEWASGPACAHAALAVRGLKRLSFDAELLITEPRVCPAEVTTAPNDLVLGTIPRSPLDTQADIWLSLLRHLEERGPCVYVSNQDWVGSLISPRLSNRVQVIGVLHEDLRAEYDHLARLGRFWNAIVCFDPALRQRIIGEYPRYAARLAAFPRRELNGEELTADFIAAAYVELIGKGAHDLGSGLYRRQQRKIVEPPAQLLGGASLKAISQEVKRVNRVPVWPDLPVTQKPTLRGARTATSLRDHRIVLAVPTGRVSGVDIFSINLARALVKLGYRAELVQTEPEATQSDLLPIPSGVPVSQLELRQHPSWKERWRAMQAHLEQRGPCIYLPNYDTRHSSIAPILSSGVKIVGIAHSDDPQHYNHIVNLAPYWDAVVGVSTAVTATIAALAPGIEARQWTIPYGVSVPGELPRRDPGRNGDPLRLVYAGRVVRSQKRAHDLPSIASSLERRGVPVELTVAGKGADLLEILDCSGSLVLDGRIRYAGAVNNDDVQALLASSDVFVLPSSFEGLPVSLLEAMAQGCVPVVTAIRSGTPEVVSDSENGFVVPVGGIEEFAERISWLAGNREVLGQMRSRAYETVRQRYGIDQMVERYLELFEQITSLPYVRPRGRIKSPPLMARLVAVGPRFPMPVRKVAWRVRNLGG